MYRLPVSVHPCAGLTCEQGALRKTSRIKLHVPPGFEPDCMLYTCGRARGGTHGLGRGTLREHTRLEMIATRRLKAAFQAAGGAVVVGADSDGSQQIPHPHSPHTKPTDFFSAIPAK